MTRDPSRPMAWSGMGAAPDTDSPRESDSPHIDAREDA